MAETTTLYHTTKGKGRVVAGLSWDAQNNAKISLLDKVLKREERHEHDLDITCYIYNDKKAFVDFVGAEAEVSIDETHKIYHSGNDTTGEGEGDDEYISAELSELPESVHGIVFLIEVRSGQTFDEVAGAACRLADGTTNKDLLSLQMAPESGAGKNAFVFCALSRDDDEFSETGWNLTKICDYPDLSHVKHWGNYLAQYV